MQWEYNPKNYTGSTFQLIPPGTYRVKIENAEEAVSKNTGKDMIKLTLQVQGYNSRLWHYVVLDDSNQEAKARTDNSLGQIFDSFSIEIGNFNLNEWIGKVGVANVKHRPNNRNEMQANVSWFVSRSKQNTIPEWNEDDNLNSEMVNFDDKNSPIPF